MASQEFNLPYSLSNGRFGGTSAFARARQVDQTNLETIEQTWTAGQIAGTIDQFVSSLADFKTNDAGMSGIIRVLDNRQALCSRIDARDAPRSMLAGVALQLKELRNTITQGGLLSDDLVKEKIALVALEAALVMGDGDGVTP